MHDPRRHREWRRRGSESDRGDVQAALITRERGGDRRGGRCRCGGSYADGVGAGVMGMGMSVRVGIGAGAGVRVGLGAGAGVTAVAVRWR
jgi:hypothetical protein